MSIAPQPRDRRPADAHSEKSPASAGRDHWASLLFQAAGDAAETRRRIAVRDEQIQRLTDVATAEWHWNHSQHELDFLIYFDRRDSTQLRAIELTQVDGELPTPYQRLRFEEELETEIAAADELLEHLVARAAEASWPS
jgi:hypothetical protein